MFIDKGRSNRVEIEWVWSESGGFWHCPVCFKNPGLGGRHGYHRPGAEEECTTCGSKFVSIPGDVSGSEYAPTFGYLCVVRGTPPKPSPTLAEAAKLALDFLSTAGPSDRNPAQEHVIKVLQNAIRNGG